MVGDEGMKLLAAEFWRISTNRNIKDTVNAADAKTLRLRGSVSLDLPDWTKLRGTIATASSALEHRIVTSNQSPHHITTRADAIML